MACKPSLRCNNFPLALTQLCTLYTTLVRQQPALLQVGCKTASFAQPLRVIGQGLAMHERVWETPESLKVLMCLLFPKSNHLSQEQLKSLIITLKSSKLFCCTFFHDCVTPFSRISPKFIHCYMSI